MTGQLDRLLTSLDVRLHAFAVCNVASGNRLVFEAMDLVVVHYVLAGAGLLEVDGSPPRVVAPGMVLIVPPKRAQKLTGGSTIERDVDAGDHCAMVVDGLIEFDAALGEPPALMTICATVSATYGGSLGLFDRLTAPIVDHPADDDRVRGCFDQLIAERRTPRLGTSAVCEALMKQCFIIVLRRVLADGGEAAMRLGSAADPRLAAAVAAVIEKPAGDHSVQSLARAAGMSRTVFARAFADAYRSTPMAFVQSTRLHHAARLLVSTDLSVKVVAASTGFASRSHFSRKFSAAYKRDPSAYRALHRGDHPDAPPTWEASPLGRLIGREVL